jgi:hypothetical protein
MKNQRTQLSMEDINSSVKIDRGIVPKFCQTIALLWWDYLEGGSKSMGDCLDFDENFELDKI